MWYSYKIISRNVLTNKKAGAKINTKREKTQERREKMAYESVNPIQIGCKLRELRQKKNKTIDEAAHDLNISVSAIGMYESGKRIPRDEIKIRIAEYYKVPVTSIFFPKKQHGT